MVALVGVMLSDGDTEGGVRRSHRSIQSLLICLAGGVPSSWCLLGSIPGTGAYSDVETPPYTRRCGHRDFEWSLLLYLMLI